MDSTNSLLLTAIKHFKLHILLIICFVPGLKAQLYLHLQDSSWLTTNRFSIYGELIKKGKTIPLQDHSGDGGSPDATELGKRIKWTARNCTFMDWHDIKPFEFWFDRNEVYKNGGRMVIIASLNGKYVDSLEIKLPIPTKISFGSVVQPIVVNKYAYLQGEITFNNQKTYPLNNPTFSQMFEINCPEGVKFHDAQFLFLPEKYFAEQNIAIGLNGFPNIKAIAKVKPMYNDRILLLESGGTGHSGQMGAKGQDACPYCKTPTFNGQDGKTGVEGLTGQNGADVEVWVRTFGDSISLFTIKKLEKIQSRYIDFKNGGSVLIFSGGGRGGYGGRGGPGGKGADTFGGMQAGKGGQGGMGGNGGKGGNGGCLTIYSDKESLEYLGQIEFHNDGGDGGQGGEGGEGGRSGLGGVYSHALNTKNRKPSGRDGYEGSRGSQGRKGAFTKTIIVSY